jgi:hypothetical protein
MESRIREKVFVELCSFDNAAYEITSTMDVSLHGARVSTKAPWERNQRLSVRSIQGDLFSHARVVYCSPLPDRSFSLGLELHNPAGDWPAPGKPSSPPQPL